MVVRFLLILFIAIISGCTTAVPNVSSLGESLFLSSKSPSPFDQQSNSGAIVFSGSCTALSNTFEYRIDGVTTWQSILPTPPTPGYGEWVPIGQVYDVDCSDGTFNFYVFVSQIMTVATAHYGTLSSDYEPSLMEIRTLNSSYEENPGTLVYQRPVPSGYRLNSYSSSQWWMGLVERGQPIQFEVSLISATGNEAKPIASMTIDLNVEVASGSSAGLGTFYYQDCITAIDITAKTFTTSDKRKSFCYIPNNVTPGARMRIVVSGNALSSHNHEFNVVATDTVFLELRPLNDSNQSIPTTLVKGAAYKFQMALNTFYNSFFTRNVQSFSGTFNLSSGSNDINLNRVGNDVSCPANSVSSTTCNISNRTQAPIELSVNTNSSLSNLNLNLMATEGVGCANCLIYYPNTNSTQPIAGYVNQNLNYQLVSGPLTYWGPTLNFPDSSLKQFECREILISLANSNGHTLPAPAQAPTLRIQGNVGFSFSKEWGCSGAVGNFGGMIQKMVLRPDGKIIVAGTFTNHGSQTRNRIAIINPDGSLDRNFMGPENVFNGNITGILPLPDGRILVSGDAANLSNDLTSKDYLVMLRPDGRIDSSFPFRTNSAVYSMIFDETTSKIFIAGDFSQVYQASTPYGRNARIASFDYAVDSGNITLNSWGSSLSLNSTVFSLMAKAGKLYVGGGFTTVNGGTAPSSIARFDIATSVYDNWPTVPSGPNNAVLTMDFDPNQNRIIIGGLFTAIGVTNRNRIAAFDLAGNLTTFDPNANNSVNHLKVVGDRLYASGTYSMIGGSARTGISQFNLTNDSLTTWNPASNSAGYHPFVISHEAAFISGSFTSLGGISANLLGRVDLASAAGMVEFGIFSPNNQTALSFSPYDLIKKIYIRADGSLTGPATITVSDGSRIVNLNLEVRP